MRYVLYIVSVLKMRKLKLREVNEVAYTEKWLVFMHPFIHTFINQQIASTGNCSVIASTELSTGKRVNKQA